MKFLLLLLLLILFSSTFLEIQFTLFFSLCHTFLCLKHPQKVTTQNDVQTKRKQCALVNQVMVYCCFIFPFSLTFFFCIFHPCKANQIWLFFCRKHYPIFIIMPKRHGYIHLLHFMLVHKTNNKHVSLIIACTIFFLFFSSTKCERHLKKIYIFRVRRGIYSMKSFEKPFTCYALSYEECSVGAVLQTTRVVTSVLLVLVLVQVLRTRQMQTLPGTTSICTCKNGMFSVQKKDELYLFF